MSYDLYDNTTKDSYRVFDRLSGMYDAATFASEEDAEAFIATQIAAGCVIAGDLEVAAMREP